MTDALTEKHDPDWWNEVSRLAELLQQWNGNRDSQELRKQVFASMEKLGLIVPKNKKS